MTVLEEVEQLGYFACRADVHAAKARNPVDRDTWEVAANKCRMLQLAILSEEAAREEVNAVINLVQEVGSEKLHTYK
jgi:hypothetical protein